MAKGFLLDERREGTAVADHYDGHGGVAYVHHQVLVVAGLGADLRYTDMSRKGKGNGCVKSPLRPDADAGSRNLALIFSRFVGKNNKIRKTITTRTHREDDEDRDELREAKRDPELE